MKTIAVINQKGGVGKTACAYNLAHKFAEKKQTMLIDLDPSANATKGLRVPYTEGATSYDFLTKSWDYNHYAWRSDQLDNLWVIPSHIKLALAQRDLQNKPFRETILSKKISSFHLVSDRFLILDCPPTLSDLTINAIYAADFILIPVTYENDALEGLADLFQVINEIKEAQQFTFKILRNQKDSRKTRTNEYIEEKLSDFIAKGHVLKTIIRQDEAINQAKIQQQTIFQYAPNSHGATDFNSLAEELINDKT